MFKTTETYRSGAEGREKIENLLRTLYSLLEDLMFLQSGAGQLVRNTDILGELKKMSESADFAWVQRAAEGLGEVERGLRRNLLRSLSLDAFATALEGLLTDLSGNDLMIHARVEGQALVSQAGRAPQTTVSPALHKRLSSPARCDTVTLSSHLWTHNHRLKCCGIFCPPVRAGGAILMVRF